MRWVGSSIFFEAGSILQFNQLYPGANLLSYSPLSTVYGAACGCAGGLGMAPMGNHHAVGQGQSTPHPSGAGQGGA